MCVDPCAGVPRHVDVLGIRADLLKLQHVQQVEELKLWALTADKTAAIVHLQLGETPPLLSHFTFKNNISWGGDVELLFLLISVFVVCLAPGIVGNWEDVQTNARRLLMMSHGVTHCTVQLQTQRHGPPQSCTNCLTPSAWTQTASFSLSHTRPHRGRASERGGWTQQGCNDCPAAFSRMNIDLIFDTPLIQKNYMTNTLSLFLLVLFYEFCCCWCVCDR